MNESELLIKYITVAIYIFLFSFPIVRTSKAEKHCDLKDKITV